MKGAPHHHYKALSACNLGLAPPGTQSRDAEAEDGGVILCRGRLGRRSLPELVAENAVMVFGKRGCCMSHVIRRLLISLGVNPAVHEVEDAEEFEVSGLLQGFGVGACAGVEFPAVCIGGRFFGGLDRVMATHISGDLVPALKQAGALWL